jgi:hypothetical protein
MKKKLLKFGSEQTNNSNISLTLAEKGEEPYSNS